MSELVNPFIEGCPQLSSLVNHPIIKKNHVGIKTALESIRKKGWTGRDLTEALLANIGYQSQALFPFTPFRDAGFPLTARDALDCGMSNCMTLSMIEAARIREMFSRDEYKIGFFAIATTKDCQFVHVGLVVQDQKLDSRPLSTLHHGTHLSVRDLGYVWSEYYVGRAEPTEKIDQLIVCDEDIHSERVFMCPWEEVELFNKALWLRVIGNQLQSDQCMRELLESMSTEHPFHRSARFHLGLVNG